MSESPDPRIEQGLVAGGDADLDRLVRQDLDKVRAELLLERQDASAELTREIEKNIRAPLVLGEISGLLDRLDGPVVPTFMELQDLLAVPDSAGLQIERNLLTDLLRDGVEGQSILKTGVLFVKHRRFREGLEWWSLQRESLDPSTSRLHLLLLIMEALTHSWAGDKPRAAAVSAQVLAHPLYRRRHGGLARG
jgi:hypothetical protein